MTFKKFLLLSSLFIVISGFFVWRYYQNEQAKKAQDDYYNSIYSYSGDYEIGDYVFLGDKGLVAQWISKDPKEDKKIQKYIQNDSDNKTFSGMFFASGKYWRFAISY